MEEKGIKGMEIRAKEVLHSDWITLILINNLQLCRVKGNDSEHMEVGHSERHQQDQDHRWERCGTTKRQDYGVDHSDAC